MKKTFTRLLICLCLVWTSSQLYAGDGYLTHVSLQKYMKTGVNNSISVWIQNLSGSNISSCKVGWKLDNGTAQISPTINIGGGGLATGGYYLPYTHPSPMNVSTVGQHTVKVWVQATGETNLLNDTVTMDFIGLSTYANKVLLFEELTATWCTSCPDGYTATTSIAALSGTAVARFHSSDALSSTDGSTYYYTYFNGGSILTPSGVINMGEAGNYPINSQSPAWVGDVTTRANGISPLALTMTPNLNTGTRQLNVDLTANFNYSENGDYYMNVYVLENGIVSTQAGVSGPFTHDLTVRAMLGGPTGTGAMIPATPIVGTNYTKSYSYTIPAAWNINKLVLIGLVFSKDGILTNTINSTKYSYDNTGILTNPISENGFNTYPNPFNDRVSIDVIDNLNSVDLSINSVDGKLMLNKKLDVQKGDLIDLNVADYPAGIYTVKMQTNDRIFIKKIVKFN
jgi:hypothetical protein